MTAGPTGPLGMTPAGMKVTGAADRNRGSRVGTGMTNKLGFSARLVALVLLSLAAGDQARAGGGVVAVPPPPISLTASDGAGLELVSLTADVAIDDPLAFTELHLAFRNPESRVREGRFRITLPSGAIISRFAMRIGERWQEGEIVTTSRIRRSWRPRRGTSSRRGSSPSRPRRRRRSSSPTRRS